MAASGEGTLWSLRYYDSFYESNATIDRPDGSNVDRFLSEKGDPFAICRLSVIEDFTEGDNIPFRAVYEDAISVALAIQHLNTGDGSIVPQIDGLHEKCPIRFTMMTADSASSGGIALKHVVDQTGKACAFIGSYRSSVSMPMAIVTGLLGYPQVSPASTSEDLDDRSQYPLFGRTLPSDAGNAVPLVLYLRNVLQMTHLAVININDSYGNAYVDGMRQAAAEYAPDLIIQQIPVDENAASIQAAVTSVKQNGFRFVFCLVFGTATHDQLMLEAYNQGVAGNGLHNWVFGDSFLGTLDDRTFEKDSALYNAYRGVGLLEVSGGVTGMEKFDTYLTQMSKMRNELDMDYLRRLWPRTDLDIPDFVQADHPSFLNQVITNGFSPFAYEAAIALGLSACQAVEDAENGELFLNGTKHYDLLKKKEFDGISGHVVFDPTTGTRLPETALYRVVNYVPVPVDTNTPGDVYKFNPVLTHLFIDTEWEVRNDYMFNDGTTNLPVDLAPPASDTSKNILIGTVCGAMALLVLAASLVWCLIREQKRKSNDSVWIVPKRELVFADPPEILGRGQFGLVLSAEYRGTKVAVKRAIPPKKSTKKSSFTSGSMASGSSSGKNGSENRRSVFDVDPESLSGCDPSSTHGDASEDCSGFSSGASRTGSTTHTTSWSNTSGLSGLAKLRKNSVASDYQNYRKMREDFVEEMRYLSRLRHPCITTVMGAVMEKNEDPMLVMEYMDHGSLYDLLHNETMVLEGDQLLQILCDISQGIRFLHTADPQVVHGDLKAANILVDTRFRAKVADFGLSQKKNIGGTGTPFWMAPELLRGESTNTDKTDVYSFGIILFEVFSRRDPYEGQPAKDVLRAVADPLIRKRPLPPKHMPPPLKALMTDCLENDPDKRPSFEEIDTRLKRIDAEAALSASTSFAKNSHVSLFDIFPRHVAEALRDGRKVEPEHKDVVTIFFSDIVGFTDISAKMDPAKVAKMLDRLYHKFDALSHKHDIFKVETIGDAYMAVTNLVKDQSKDHAQRVAQFAIEAVAAANGTLIDESDPSKGHVNIRAGFHSGPVVADVVGNRNPRYCLFGDTVNTASRMESNSAMNRINCSEEAAKYLKDQAPEISLKPRGLISIKGKGEMKCFWVNEVGTVKDSALERVRAKQKLKLLQQEIDQWGSERPVQEQAPDQESSNDGSFHAAKPSESATKGGDDLDETPSEFSTMKDNLSERLGRAKKYDIPLNKFL